jgi:hypothetical protein
MMEKEIEKEEKNKQTLHKWHSATASLNERELKELETFKQQQQAEWSTSEKRLTQGRQELDQVCFN